MQTLDNSRQVTFQFESLIEMAKWLRATPRTWRQNSSDHHKATQDWDLGLGYAKAEAMAHDGWPEGVGLVSALVDSLPTGRRVERTFSVAGEYPDVPRAVAGSPFNMVRRGFAHKPKKTMTIVVNCCTSGGTSGVRMANHAAALVSVIDRIENRGVSVELYGMVVTVMSDRRRGVIAWRIKGAGDALDLSAIAFGVGHPAMYRRLVFGAWERLPRSMESLGYGSIVPMKHSDLIDLPEDALCIDGLMKESTGQGRGSLREAIQQAEAHVNRAAAKVGHEPIAELEDA